MNTNKLIWTMAVALVSAASYAQTVDEIVDKHVAALGGLDKIKGVNTVVTDRSWPYRAWKYPIKRRW
jgi:hypothetical protein